MGQVYNEMVQAMERGDLSFHLEKPKAVFKRSAAGQKPRPTEAPKEKIQKYRDIADTDPHVGEGIDILVDYLVGSGFNIDPANVPYTDTEQSNEDIAPFKLLIEMSPFDVRLQEWVKTTLIDGTGFLEVVVEDDVFKPKLLPTERMLIQKDEQDNIVGYEMEVPGERDNVEFGPFDIAVLYFHKHPGEDFGHSVIQKCEEQADMLRDMEIDLARFIATKAYPPIIWKLGTEERPWSQPQIKNWLQEAENIEPDSMLAVGHDIDHDVVGVTSTSSTSGAMKLEETFVHLQKRIYTGLGVPAFLGNIDIDVNRNTSVAIMPKFDRRIQRYRRRIRDVVRNQIFVSILGHPTPEDYDELPPEFEFGQHSSDEERLEIDAAITLFNEGFLTRDAFAQRVGIDPEMEMPDESELAEIVALLQQLRGAGDEIQNPDGGSPTETGAGAESPGGEVSSRQNPERDSSEGRRQRDISNE